MSVIDKMDEIIDGVSSLRYQLDNADWFCLYTFHNGAEIITEIPGVAKELRGMGVDPVTDLATLEMEYNGRHLMTMLVCTRHESAKTIARHYGYTLRERAFVEGG
ncbi:MAG: hypothetical protein CME17_05045 [Gemmatimonadetes bacterium]|nr:hypothetical protein [Gemmatimonadota bacterium]|tara:strand:- start:2268 stop:2582 length:315 start_codon:yes stop_codon:yes gene_type:complete